MLFSRSIAWTGKKVITYYLKRIFPISANLAVFCRSVYATKNPCGVAGFVRKIAWRIEIALKIVDVNGPLTSKMNPTTRVEKPSKLGLSARSAFSTIGSSRRHRGRTLSFRAVTSILTRRLLYKMTNPTSSVHVRERAC